jgi:hypothetical protein
MDPQGGYYGLNNIYNMNNFYNLVTNSAIDLNGYTEKTAARFKLDSSAFPSFQKVMKYHTSEWLLDGIIADYTPDDLVIGFDTTIASKINTGTLLNGNIWVDP